jgi:hypothetical protein
MKIQTLRSATAALIVYSMISVTACASHEETTTTVTPATAEYPATATTTTTTVSNEEHDSVVGATLHAVGTIILFPFRLVGDAISLIV